MKTLPLKEIINNIESRLNLKTITGSRFIRTFNIFK